MGTIAGDIGSGGTQAIRDFLNLPEYSSKLRRKSLGLEQLEEKADAAAKANDDDLDTSIDYVVGALSATNAAQADTLPLRELQGIDKALRNIRGEKAVQESKNVSLQLALEGYRKDLERPGTTERADQIEREIRKAAE